MGFETYVKNQYHWAKGMFPKNIKEERLYLDITDGEIRYIFAAFHSRFNTIFGILNRIAKEQEKKISIKQNSQLIDIVKRFNKLNKIFSSTEFTFKIDPEYLRVIKFVQRSLIREGITTLPINFKPLEILDEKPIFFVGKKRERKESMIFNTDRKIVDHGSYATVSKYKDSFYNITIAVKTAKSSLTKSELVRFKKEFELMRSLDSPYIAKVYHYSDEKNEFYMEFIRYTLQKFIQKEPDISIDARKSIVEQIFLGLEYIHSKGFFHRDISLKNIMINKHDDGSIIVKLLDFGYVKDKESTLTRNETMFQGSLNDPQLKRISFKKYDIQHEIYALTQVIFFVMTGRENLTRTQNKTQDDFLAFGMEGNLEKRAQTLDEIYKKFLATNWE